MINKTDAKILLFDLETAPAKAYVFSMYDVNLSPDHIIEDDYVLMYAAKWLGQDKIMTDAVCFHSKPGSYSKTGQKAVLKSLSKLIEEADIIIGHNSDDFDIKWLNDVLIRYDMKPVSTFRSVDTKKEARKIGRHMSASLDALSKKYKLGRKRQTGGITLWSDCMSGIKASWTKMITYCKQDVVLLEKLYLKLRPFIKTHPNLGLFKKTGKKCCPNCASEDIKKKGFFYTATSKYQRYICNDCGKNVRDTKRIEGSDFVGV